MTGGVERGGHGALELAELRQHLRRQGHEGAGILLGEDGLHPLLVHGIGVGVQEDHGHRGHAELGELPRRAPRAVLVERGEDGAVGVEPLGHLQHAVGRDGPRGLAPSVEVAVARDVVAADLEHVLEARGGDERGRRRLALENGIRGRRRAVKDAQDVGGRAPRLGEHLADGGDEAARQVTGRRWCLRDPGGARAGVGEGDVGEGAAHVDGDRPGVWHARHCRRIGVLAGPAQRLRARCSGAPPPARSSSVTVMQCAGGALKLPGTVYQRRSEGA
jgi:hypothetical protein